MATFEDLPIEIILEIVKFSTPINPTGDRIGKDDLCKLRLVSRHLNAAVSPVLFAEVRLGFDDADTPEPDPAPDCSRCQEIIIALANGSTRVFEHTQRLELCTQKLYWNNDDYRVGLAELKSLVVDKIFDAASSLKNLRTVKYFCNPEYDPEALGIEFIRALSTLPSFEGFTYLMFLDNPPPSFTLQPLRNLTILHTFWSWDKPVHLIPELAALLTRCPNLSELYLGGGPSNTHDDATFNGIFARLDETNNGMVLKLKKLELRGVLVTPDDIKKHIRHLQELTFLGITNNPAPEASAVFGSICSLLQQHSIFLKGVSTDTVNDPAFLSYLTSYSGLTQLKLGGEYRSTDTPEVVEKIYTKVLPKHKDTLEDLQLGSVKVDVWCKPPTDEQLAELVKCQKLRTLEVCMTPRGDDTTMLETWLEVGLQLPNLAHLMMVPNLAQSVRARLMRLHKLRKEVVKRFREKRGMRFRVNND